MLTLVCRASRINVGWTAGNPASAAADRKSPNGTDFRLFVVVDHCGVLVARYLGRPRQSNKPIASDDEMPAMTQKESAEETDASHDMHSTPSAQTVPMLEFSNNFECANLSCVMRVRDAEYDITLWRDYNTCVWSTLLVLWRRTVHRT